jgi:ubiquitin-conjugating enzyme (huntingtin interacting protein 2)
MQATLLLTHTCHSLYQGAICLDTLGTGWSPVGTIKMALISLRMLLESPNPKDPQDAEVAKMMMEQPNEFAAKAHDWAVKYAGAPRRETLTHNYQKSTAPVVKDDPSRYVFGEYRRGVVRTRGGGEQERSVRNHD